jgi:hypothetical protein
MTQRGLQTEKNILEALRDQTPVRGLPGVRIRSIRPRASEGFDVQFEIESGDKRVSVFGEIKSELSPKLLEEIAPWIRRMKSLRQGVVFALLCPVLSPRSQAFCIQNGIDFLDLAGNISVNVPGVLTLQRLGMRSTEGASKPSSLPATNPFSGRSSRVLRVLLEKTRPWTGTEIAKELQIQSNIIARTLPNASISFGITLGAISKVISSLDEQLWIRRQGSSITVPEPRRLLLEWAEKYKERYRWRLRSSFETSNPLGGTPTEISAGLQPLIRGPYAFTGAAAATDAPFVNVDRADVFLIQGEPDKRLRALDLRQGFTTIPKLRFIYAYDEGVLLYARNDTSFPRVSNIQAYLDLYARGGRDLKQAGYLLDNAIAPKWEVT